jgi:2'-5' RNA ligase
MDSSPTLRLFVALSLEEETTQRLIMHHTELPAVQWTPAENLHLTLRYIGQTPSRKVGDVQQALTHINFSTFTYDITRMDCWQGSILHASVVLAPSLRRLYQTVEHALSAAGIAPETREFHPHITLARAKKASHEAHILDWLAARQHLSIQAQATRLHLYWSHRTARGLTYDPLFTVTAE